MLKEDQSDSAFPKASTKPPIGISDIKLALLGFFLSVIPVLITFIVTHYYTYGPVFIHGANWLEDLSGEYTLHFSHSTICCFPFCLLFLIAPCAALILRGKRWRTIVVIVLAVIYGLFNSLIMVAFLYFTYNIIL